jgi:hypothetical protein
MKTMLSATALIALSLAHSATAQVAGAVLQIRPEAVSSCVAPIVATVAWNAMSAGVNAVKIFVVDEKGVERIFTQGGASGEAKTEKWVSPGLEFVMKDQNEKTILARTTVKSNPC